ncbi:MAG: hypothetical protein ACJ8LL_00630 [Candidatus Udaeobacter sp.]
MPHKVAEGAHRCTRFDAFCVLLLISYFLYFALPARHGGFREDEMMNLWTYWYMGPGRLLFALAKFWAPYYRPGGGIYYLPLYHFFGLNPLPYRIVQIGILVLSIPIAYYLARLLASSRSVAFLAVLAFLYHPYVASVVFVGAFIYDVLCGLFYVAALTYYVHIREKGSYLRPLQLVLFLALYIFALNSKEMAVSLPVIVLIYELLKSPRWASWSAFLSWSWRCATPSLITGAMTAIYLYSKIYGTGSITRFEAYRPSYSWHNFVTSNARFVGELLYAPEATTPIRLLLLWAAVFIYALFRRDRLLWLMALWVVIVPLPIAFLLPIRSGGCLYLLLFGWAMICARASCDLIAFAANALVVHSKKIGIYGTGPARIEKPVGSAARGALVVQISSATAGETPGRNVRLVLVSVLAVSFALFTVWENRRLATVPHFLGIGQKVSHVIAAFDSLNLRPAHHSTVLLKVEEGLFQNKWHPSFIAFLVWNDHSLEIWTDKLSKIAPERLAEADYIISLTEFEAKVIRSPNGHKTK